MRVFDSTPITIRAARRLPREFHPSASDVVDVDAGFTGASTSAKRMYDSVQYWFSRGYTFVEEYADGANHPYLRMRKGEAPTGSAMRLCATVDRLLAVMDRGAMLGSRTQQKYPRFSRGMMMVGEDDAVEAFYSRVRTRATNILRTCHEPRGLQFHSGLLMLVKDGALLARVEQSLFRAKQPPADVSEWVAGLPRSATVTSAGTFTVGGIEFERTTHGAEGVTWKDFYG